MSRRIRIFGIDIDVLDMRGAVDYIVSSLSGSDGAFRYVVTPNVDHIVKLSSDSVFLEAYEGASLVVADGRPVVAAARLLGSPLPGVVPGSDLVPEVFEFFQKTHRPLTVFLLGAAPGVAERAKNNIEKKWPCVEVVGVMSPSYGFEHDELECARICEAISVTRAELLIVGLGAPKQEVWVYKNSFRLVAKVALCVGATIDFLAGEKSRAPLLFRRLGIEWVHRMLTEPRRLARRYAYDAWVFPRLFFREFLSRQRTGRVNDASGDLP